MSEHILVLNASPRADKGITELILETFLSSCRKAGATTETIYLSKMDITPCAGELACFFRQWKKCEVFPKDDGNLIAEKFRQADRVVLASPLHVYGVASHLTRTMERLVCLAGSNLAINDGVWTHPPPYKANRPSAVIGVCAFPGAHNFVLFKETMLTMQKVFWLQPGGNVLVPMSRDLSVLGGADPRRAEHQRILDACARAGVEFMKNDCISRETEEEISRPAGPIEELVKTFESYFVAMQGAS
ncbi:MAG: hypothetical protein C0617_06025 [Desulfuromonas sp.]|uniref:flavodoxin family protein n=1 Tax=Desulfuromonas sp. TaxID=892 RepID=UPI000CC4D69C|nr:flavodoxin family protein [Desulfuromonas sp.]PLX84903.1 MAG: hypothetical protein C0617_06025 [Desulfuromonas sp.]